MLQQRVETAKRQQYNNSKFESNLDEFVSKTYARNGSTSRYITNTRFGPHKSAYTKGHQQQQKKKK